MDRRTALKTVLAMIVSSHYGTIDTVLAETVEEGRTYFAVETVSFSLDGVETIELQWKGKRATIEICELMDVLLDDGTDRDGGSLCDGKEN